MCLIHQSLPNLQTVVFNSHENPWSRLLQAWYRLLSLVTCAIYPISINHNSLMGLETPRQGNGDAYTFTCLRSVTFLKYLADHYKLHFHHSSINHLFSALIASSAPPILCISPFSGEYPRSPCFSSLPLW